MGQNYKYIATLLLFIVVNVTQGQVNNDECFSATNVVELADFCSTGYTNSRATRSGDDAPSCWDGDEGEADVWYSFIPLQEGMLLRFFGRGETNTFTLSGVDLAVYEGRCDQLMELRCRDDNPSNEFELLFNALVIGRPHFIRVSSDNGSSGTFQLCLRQFVPIPEPQQDCNTGVVLCDKSTFVVEKLENGGLDNREGEGTCLWESGDTSPSETGSVWYKWTAAKSGTLTFTIIPNNDDPKEDLDFAVFKFPDGLNDCVNKVALLCMASGETAMQSESYNRPCLGPTGLRSGDPDLIEFRGCDGLGDNNFLAPLDMVAGESYGLLVNNFSESGFGFSIEFGGTGEFLGPDADFSFSTVDDFECDKTITFENMSDSMTDSIVSWRWRFGEGAQPQQESGEGPHDVIYESFGPKVAVLTVMTDRGCQVTKVLDLEVAACCDDMALLTLTPDVSDLSCFGSADGSIMAIAQNGSPDYLYSLDGGPLLPTDIFNGLSVGEYVLSARDIKGCDASETIVITQPEEIILNISGPTDTIELGEGAQFFSDFSPMDRELIYVWTPPDGLACTDCPNPEVIPPGTTIYTLTVVDQDGCTQMRDIIIFAEGKKPLYAPNIISLTPSIDMANGFFRVFSDISADALLELIIYDRWGSELYRADNVDLEDPSYSGWDGKVSKSDQKVNPGVFVWIAKVRFIDGDVRTFTGDLTVVD